MAENVEHEEESITYIEYEKIPARIPDFGLYDGIVEKEKTPTPKEAYNQIHTIIYNAERRMETNDLIELLVMVYTLIGRELLKHAHTITKLLKLGQIKEREASKP